MVLARVFGELAKRSSVKSIRSWIPLLQAQAKIDLQPPPLRFHLSLKVRIHAFHPAVDR